MVATFYKFSKKTNSISRPTGTGISVPVSLKESSSAMNPVLIIRDPNFPDYNYMYLPIFDRYYFIEDIIYDTGVWVVRARVDVLASYRTEINNTKAYVIFSDSAADEDVIDNRITVGAGVQYSRQLYEMEGVKPATVNGAPNGTFGVTVLAHNDDAALATGGVITYYMKRGQFQTFTNELTNPDAWNDFKMYFGNALDGIIECFYIPFDVTSYVPQSASRRVKIGDYEFPSATGTVSLLTELCAVPKSLTIDLTEDFTILWKATALEPARAYTMFFPFCGEKPIDARLFYGSRYLTLDYSVDFRTGNIQAILSVNQKVIQEFNGNCKVELPISKEYFRMGGTVGATAGAMTAIAGFASGNVALGATGVLSAISSVAVPADIRTMGGFSGSVLGGVLGTSEDGLNPWQHIILTEARRQVTQWPTTYKEVIGGACNKVYFIRDLTGYCQTSQFSLQCSATSEEIDQVNRLMDAGVFLDNVINEE